MRHTISDLRFYVDRINGVTREQYRLQREYGYYTLLKKCGKGESDVVIGLSCREMYYVLVAMYAVLISEAN